MLWPRFTKLGKSKVKVRETFSVNTVHLITSECFGLSSPNLTSKGPLLIFGYVCQRTFSDEILLLAL